MKKLLLLLITFSLVIHPCLGQKETSRLRISASVLPRTALEIDSGTLSFISTGDVINSMIPAAENEIEITVKLRLKNPDKVSLTVSIPDDLVDPGTGNRIPAENVHWRISGQNEHSGKLAKGIPQIVAQWNKSGLWRCRISFFLEKSEDYIAGNYGQKIIFSLMSF